MGNNIIQHNGSVNIHDYGIKLEINPVYLYKQDIHPISQNILDKIIEAEFKILLNNAHVFLSDFFDKNGGYSEGYTLIKESETPYEELLNLFVFIRNISPLHTDYEMINLNQSEKVALDNTWSLCRYSTIYGFKDYK